MKHKMIEFYECGNYRGSLQALEKEGKFYWRVNCDVDSQSWIEIPEYLWKTLKQYHDETADGRESLQYNEEEFNTYY